MEARCRIELLGGLRATRHDGSFARFETGRTGRLLAYLAFHLHRSHPRGTLVALLWPEAAEAPGRHRLRKALSALRSPLEPPGSAPGALLLADRASVQLNPEQVTTDVAEFEAALAAAARASSELERGQWLSQAVALYTGELLPGFSDDWIRPERLRLADGFQQAQAQLQRLHGPPGALRRAAGANAARPSAAVARPWPEEAVAPAGTAAHTALPGSPMPAGTVSILVVEVTRLAGAPLSEADSAYGVSARLRDLRQLFQRHRGHVLQEGPDSLAIVFARISDALAAAVAGMKSGASDRQTRVGEGDAISDHTPPRHAGPLPAGRAAAAPAPARRASLRVALHAGEFAPDAGECYGTALEHATRLLLAAHAGQILCSEAAAALLRGAEEPGKTGYPLTDLGVWRLPGLASRGMPERLYHVSYPGMPQREFPPLQGALPLTERLSLPLTRFFGREVEIERLCALVGGTGDGGRQTGDGGRWTGDGSGERWSPPDHRLPSTVSRLPSAASRLVTLTGPGGSGKSRLALEVARRLTERRHGGARVRECCFVPLADLRDARRIPETVRDALRLPRSPHLDPLEQVVAALTRQPVVLIVDNFEHLVDEGAAVIEALRERVPSLTLFITSRQPLRLEGEQEYPLAPLPIPGVQAFRRSGVQSGGHPGDPVDWPDYLSVGKSGTLNARTPERLNALLECASVALFVDRAQAVQPAFQLTEANAAVLARLCARLEGLPLAIELAAARAGVLTPQRIMQGLENRLQFLVNRRREAIGRHQSLRAALDWSYQLLSPELQRCFARLSVFRGGFTLEAAAAIGDFGFRVPSGRLDFRVATTAKAPGNRTSLSDPIQNPNAQRAPEIQNALGLLERLRECSLAMAEESGGAPGLTRYRLLETLREYAGEQLEGERELPALRRRHAHWFLALAEAAEPHLWESDQDVWLQRLEGEHDNLRAALDWAVERGEGALGLRLAAALAYFWEVKGHWTEGRERLAQILAMPGATPRSAVRARALLRAGWLAHAMADFAAARRLWEECQAITRALGDRHGLATALTSLGKLAAWPEGEPERARALLEESLAIRRELGDRAGIASTLDGLGNLLRTQGDYEGAVQWLSESVALRRELGDRAGIAWSLRGLGMVACGREEFARARELLAECLALFRELGYQQGILLTLESLWLALHRLGKAAEPVLAERLALCRELDSKAQIPQCLEDGAMAAHARGEAHRAAVLLAAATSLRDALSISLTATHSASLEGRLAEIRGALGKVAFEAAWREGSRLPLESAIAVAVDDPRRTGEPSPQMPEIPIHPGTEEPPHPRSSRSHQ